jgi:hypothetical protein
MKPDYRIYGRARGLSRDDVAWLQEYAPFPLEYQDGWLDVDHEGGWVDVEPFLEALSRVLPQGGTASLDVIDNPGWTITRYTATPEGVKSSCFDLDNVLESVRTG